MEAKSRSESPLLKNKTITQFPTASENGNSVIDQIKTKKKGQKNKCKSQANGKENEDIKNNRKNHLEEEKISLEEMTTCVDSSNSEHENGITSLSDMEALNGNEAVQDMENNKENDFLVSTCEVEGKIINGASSNIAVEECKSSDDIIVEIEEVCFEEGPDITESESCIDKEILMPCDSQPETAVECESTEENSSGGTNNTLNGNTNYATQEQEITTEFSETKTSSQISVNGSDVSSHYEEATAMEDERISQASPDTATKDGNSISSKITNFLEKWTYSQEQKQDSEVSSTKKVEASTLNHPYLSKVSGRRGIKDRLNSSETIFCSKDMEAKTPEHLGISLDDSFRVRTNPPRLNSVELNENPTLRKFKGKRCLNAGDEPEEESDMYPNTMKRRKLDEKTQEYRLLGGLLWSPFKKRVFVDEGPLKPTTSETKLSKLLSPFWFWKKTSANQKGK